MEADNVIKKYQSPAQATHQYTPPPQSKPSFVQNTFNRVGQVNQAVNRVPVLGNVKRTVTAGLGKVGEILNKPSEMTENFLTRGKGYETTLQNLGVKNKYAQAGLSLAGRVALDPLNLLGVGLVRNALRLPQLGTKIASMGSKISKLPKVQKAIGFARKTPLIYKPLEATVAPYFRNPEVGKIIEGTKEATTGRLQKLYRQVSDSSKGLSRTEQIRIGQLLEGGVSVSPKAEKLRGTADKFRVLGEQVGKELVDAGLLSPDDYAKYQGKYMHHFWDLGAKGQNPFMKLSEVPTISGNTQKFRTGAQGYVKEFAPATFKGLGSSIKDIEAAKMFKTIAAKFGISADKLRNSDDLTKELVNLLVRTTKKPTPGLGPVKAGFKTPQNMGSYLLDVIKQYQPAHRTSKDVGMGIKATQDAVNGGGEMFKKVLNPKKSELFADTIWGNPKAKRAMAYVLRNMGFRDLGEGGLDIALKKVGELPLPKQKKLQLNVGKTSRNIPENFKYAPDELTKSRGGNLLKDTALPEEVIEYLKRARDTKKGPLLDIFDKGMSLWKQGKTILNPAYHVRNLASNQILSEMSTGEGLPKTVLNYLKSIKAYRGKGNQQFVNEAIDAGLIKRKNFGEATEEFLNTAFKKESKFDKIKSIPARAQQFSEDTAKLNVFSTWRKKGLSVADAMKKAEEAIFSPYKINATERGVMGRLFPFYSFTRQSLPFTAKTLIKNPQRLTKYPKLEKTVENISRDEAPNEKYMPDWQKKMVRLPIKNKRGQREYLNTKYFYPWGGVLEDDAKGLPFGLNVNPLIEEYAAQKTGIDPYFKTEFIREGMPAGKRLKERTKHAANTFLPAMYRSIQGKIIPAIQGRKDYVGRERGIGKTLLGELGALKSYPFDEAAGRRKYSNTIERIGREFKEEYNIIMKDQSKTFEEKRKEVNALLKRRKERLESFTNPK